MRMVYHAAQCPQCLLHGIFWQFGRVIFCEACGPVLPAPSALTEISRRMQALRDELSQLEALVTSEL